MTGTKVKGNSTVPHFEALLGSQGMGTGAKTRAGTNGMRSRPNFHQKTLQKWFLGQEEAWRDGNKQEGSGWCLCQAGEAQCQRKVSNAHPWVCVCGGALHMQFRAGAGQVGSSAGTELGERRRCEGSGDKGETERLTAMTQTVMEKGKRMVGSERTTF